MNHQGEDAFVRLAAGIGDLANPFYREERQRDVWNEASAVGFQLLLWAGMAAAAAMVWVGGRTGLPYGITLMVLLGAASWFGITYASRLGVRVDSSVRLVRWRTLPYVLLVLAFVAGVVRAGVFTGSLGWGVLCGAVVGAGGGALALRRARRRADA